MRLGVRRLANKGGFKQEFLEDVVFLSGGSLKRPKANLAKRKSASEGNIG